MEYVCICGKYIWKIRLEKLTSGQTFQIGKYVSLSRCKFFQTYFPDVFSTNKKLRLEKLTSGQTYVFSRCILHLGKFTSYVWIDLHLDKLTSYGQTSYVWKNLHLDKRKTNVCLSRRKTYVCPYDVSLSRCKFVLTKVCPDVSLSKRKT